MIIGQTFPYLRVKSLFSSADTWGANVSHHELLRCSLQFGAANAVHFFLDPRDCARQRPTPGIAELQAEFGSERVVIQDATRFATTCRRGRYVFPVALGEMDLFSVREADRRDAFPICLKLHTVPNPYLCYSGYLGALLLGKAHDAIVATTKAGRAAVEAILDGVLEHLAAMVGKPPTRAVPIVDIPHGVDEQFLAPRDRVACRRLLGLPDAGVLYLYVGRFTDQFKADLDPLLGAFTPLARDRPDARLLLAGREGPERYGATLLQRAAALGIGQQVHLVTNFPYFLKPAIYAAADVFVSPVDNVQETFGLAIIEAMATGLPVVASDWSGYRDLIVHGTTGWLIPTRWYEAAADAARLPPLEPGAIEHVLAQRTVIDVDALHAALATLERDAGMRQRMGEAGRVRVCDRFTWRSTVTAYRELWDRQWSVLQSGDGSRPVPYPLDLNRLFAPFATGPVPTSGDLECTDSGLAVLQRRNTVPLECPGGIRAATARRILADVMGGRTPLVTVARTKQRRDTAIWLLKKGHLRVADPPSSVRRSAM